MFTPLSPRAAFWRQPYPWLLLMGLPLFAWVLFGPRGTEVEIAAKTWRREIQIERRVLEMHSDWCDRMPSDAQPIERQLRPDPAGLRDSADYCRYRALAWRMRRVALAEGSAPQMPRWPQPELAEPGTPDGERLGRHVALQTVLLRDEAGREWQCRPGLATWLGLQPGTRFRLAVDRHGVADCSTLPPPR